VAPKERVNITYRPATGDAKDEAELPLKTLVLGDFTNRPDDTPLEDRQPVQVDKDNFDSVLKAQQVHLEEMVPDRLSEEPGGELQVSLDFQQLKDFSPDAVIAQVPELKRLLDLREALKALKGPLGNTPEFRKKIQALVEDPGARERLLRELGLE
jgi:type VI secretion system protein ImpB